MLFLAVTMGFLAENLREHQLVVERKNQNLEAMIFDLKKDSARLEKLIGLYSTGLKDLEDMKFTSLQYQEGKISKKEYLSYIIQKFDNPNLGFGFYQTNAAYKNLIATGGLSVIKSEEIKKLISEYYEEYGIKLIDNNRLVDVDINDYYNKTSIFGYGLSSDTSNGITKITQEQLVEDFKSNPDFEKSIINPTFRMYTHKIEYRCGYFLNLLEICKEVNKKLLKVLVKKEY